MSLYMISITTPPPGLLWLHLACCVCGVRVRVLQGRIAFDRTIQLPRSHERLASIGMGYHLIKMKYCREHWGRGFRRVLLERQSCQVERAGG